MPERIIFSGNSNLVLANAIARELGKPLGGMEIVKFADGEICIRNVTENMRGRDVFIIQSTNPPGDNILELELIMSAAKSAASGRIIPVIPYYGYSRQDRKTEPRAPISAKEIAKQLESAGADQVIVMDLHNESISGFFNIPVNHIYAENFLLTHLKTVFLKMNLEISNDVIVLSPDAGGVRRAKRFAKKLDNCKIAIIDKRREKPNESEVMNIVGEKDIKDKNCLIIDDMIDTAGTLVKGANALKNAGAINVIGCTTHALFSRNAVSLIENSEIQKLIFTDTVLLPKEKMTPKFTQLSVAGLLAEAIRAVNNNESVGRVNAIVH